MNLSGLSRTKRDILAVALPAVSGFLSIIVCSLVDIFWISRLGAEAVAGVAASEYWMWSIEAITETTTIGCSTLIAQCVGAGSREDAVRLPREAAHLSLLVSAVLTAAFFFLGPSLLAWMGLSAPAREAGWTYLGILVLGLPVFHMILLANQVFNAHGDTKTAMLIMPVGLSVNAVLTPILAFGWLGLPAWGVAGAAWATLAGWGVGFLLRVFFLRRRGYIPPLPEFLGWSSGFFSRIVRIGTPSAASHLVWTSVYPLLTSILTVFGMAPLAGMTIGHRFENVAYFICVGFSIAAAALVGRAVGRGDLAGARRVAYEARTLVTWILVPVSLVFLLAPEALISLMSRDPDVVAHGASYLRKIGLLEVFLGWELVFQGGFNGLGDTRPYMLISVPLTLGRYPAAYLLVFGLGLGVDAVFWCITVSTLLKGLLMSRVFARVRAPDLGIAPPHAPPDNLVE